MKILGKIYRALIATVRPLHREWPFFIFAVLLLRPALFHNAYFEMFGDWLGGNSTFREQLTYFADFMTTLTFASILTYIVAFTGKVVKQGGYLLLLALFLMSIFLSFVFDRKINMLTLQQIIETNSAESKEFISVFALSKGGIGAMVLTFAFFIAITLVEKFRDKIEAFAVKISRPWLKTTVAVVLILSIVAGIIPLLKVDFYRDKIIRNYPLNTMTCMLYSVYGFREEADKMNNVDKCVAWVNHETVGTKEVDDSLNVIFILGESFIRSHGQTYGYRLPTTPRLAAEKECGNLFQFADAVSPYCSTTEIIKNVFFMNSCGEDEDWSESPFFPQLFRQAGFFVNMCDNQTPSATTEDFDKAGRLLLHNKSITKNAYSAVTPIRHQYDLDNIIEFDDINKDNNPPRQLLIFHLMGQHIYATERYPHVEPFVKFTEDDYPQSQPYLDVEHRRVMAAWDNATVYNDSVIAYVIDRYRDANTLLVYFSDHGEEVYDYRDRYGRHEPERDKIGEWAHCVFDVPFFIWCSDKYMRRHPDKVKAIKAALDRQFSTDVVPNMVINLSGLSTRYYRAEHDPLSREYRPSRRLIHSSDGQIFDYDKVTGRR